ncbi:glutamine synthetase family protein [Mucilaginibacter sp. BJC16-A38]|uniref:glutamine synthetase family protein n=1 Tax=Mucilaginibacter phenanthrenivorans TaxID=1234842 RepID=UPI00215896B6|nr:glutamine synthetase family protein [Mucilaginibacter phenanthrenivorans]MCR8556322.1 glutamine synthetase family protein [Mucilaginibacter phenanthrenivorans]
MNEEQIKTYLKENNITKIKFAFADIDGVLRGKVIHPKKFLDGLEGGYGFCDVVWGWDSSDACYDNVKLTGWHTGYPDQMCRIDLATLRNVPWDDNIPFFLGDFSKADGNDLPACGRSLLKRIAKQCDDMGYHTEFAQEFEWFNFSETPQSLKEKGFANMESLTPGMFGYSILRTSLNDEFYNDLFDLLLQFNVPLEGLHTETGPGVYEAAILHDSVLEAADKAVLFKTAVKEIANKHGIVATFMAKWNENLPGCSGHIHQSLWTKDKLKNLFYDADDEFNMSGLHKHYLAGQLHCLPQILPMYAPTINSYKRLVEGAWAPTTVTWGVDNRTTALRVIHTSENYTRLETRIPGSDTNPYLAMAAALASGLYGIKNKLPLTIPATVGNGYQDKRNGSLSSNLFDATNIMKDSAIAKELFGEAFVDHFTNTRLWECRQFGKSVTDWELKRYFEII